MKQPPTKPVTDLAYSLQAVLDQAVNGQIGKLGSEFSKLEAKTNSHNERFDQLNAEIYSQQAKVDTKVDAALTKVFSKVDEATAKILKSTQR